MNADNSKNIKIIYDNRTIESNIIAGWGFSCLVDNSILFDTGEEGDSLLRNMKTMGVSPDGLEAVVISHDHWDHTGGLGDVLTAKKGLKVYICPGFSEEFKKNVEQLGGTLIERSDFDEIKKDIYTTGTILGEYKALPIEEQALTVKSYRGITVITGCAHPGIVKMMEKVKERFPGEKLYCVFGGFHLKNSGEEEVNTVMEKLQALGVGKFGPAHCSGDKAIGMFRERFGSDHITIAAGKVFEV
jgi:7,8-dihydropterin-6-yl-methyl-4-(beta-D-ribofuranosyl)aminobenzene 5'-phosphate synthase